MIHEREAFGPVSTIMPYKNLEEAITLAQMGKGSLVSSIATNDDNIAKEYVINAASHHGRILVLNRENAKESTGHGSPLPHQPGPSGHCNRSHTAQRVMPWCKCLTASVSLQSAIKLPSQSPKVAPSCCLPTCRTQSMHRKISRCY